MGGHYIDWLDSEVVIEVKSREVEVCGDVRADSVDNIGLVVVDSGVQLLCCASYVLFVAFDAGDEVYDIAGRAF